MANYSYTEGTITFENMSAHVIHAILNMKKATVFNLEDRIHSTANLKSGTPYPFWMESRWNFMVQIEDYGNYISKHTKSISEQDLDGTSLLITFVDDESGQQILQEGHIRISFSFDEEHGIQTDVEELEFTDYDYTAANKHLVVKEAYAFETVEQSKELLAEIKEQVDEDTSAYKNAELLEKKLDHDLPGDYDWQEFLDMIYLNGVYDTLEDLIMVLEDEITEWDIFPDE